jgi:hypothetical protein
MKPRTAFDHFWKFEMSFFNSFGSSHPQNEFLSKFVDFLNIFKFQLLWSLEQPMVIFWNFKWDFLIPWGLITLGKNCRCLAPTKNLHNMHILRSVKKQKIFDHFKQRYRVVGVEKISTKIQSVKNYPGVFLFRSGSLFSDLSILLSCVTCRNFLQILGSFLWSLATIHNVVKFLVNLWLRHFRRPKFDTLKIWTYTSCETLELNFKINRRMSSRFTHKNSKNPSNLLNYNSAEIFLW